MNKIVYYPFFYWVTVFKTSPPSIYSFTFLYSLLLLSKMFEALLFLHPWRQSSHLSQGLPRGRFYAGLFSITILIYWSCFLYACLAHFSLLKDISFVMLGCWKKSRSSRCIFLHSPVQSSLSGLKILLRIFLSKISMNKIIYCCKIKISIIINVKMSTMPSLIWCFIQCLYCILLSYCRFGIFI